MAAESAVGVVPGQCECGTCRVVRACRHFKETMNLWMRCHGAMMTAESAVGVMQCECGTCPAVSVCGPPLWASASTSVLLCWTWHFGQPPFYAFFVISESFFHVRWSFASFKPHKTVCFVFVPCNVQFTTFLFIFFRRGLLPVGLNSLRPLLSLSPVHPNLAVAVDNRVIHFLRRVGGTPGDFFLFPPSHFLFFFSSPLFLFPVSLLLVNFFLDMGVFTGHSN